MGVEPEAAALTTAAAAAVACAAPETPVKDWDGVVV